MRERWGSIHLVVPDALAGEHDDREVIQTYERTYSLIDLAKRLWRLIGNDAEAQRIQAVMSRAYERDVPTLDGSDIASLIEPVAALPPALRRELQLGPHDRLTMAQVEDLRRRFDRLDLEESRGEAAVHAVEEVIFDIEGLVEILRRAQAEGAHIIFN
ncbi:MAG: hypothetical protein K8W52_29355 [Deltaproteobacteria bacterium]|nr:hypothetical protein [Deltaproteobacteria bacterium]